MYANNSHQVWDLDFCRIDGGEYIVQYTGKNLKKGPNLLGDVMVSIKQDNHKDKKVTIYIDGNFF